MNRQERKAQQMERIEKLRANKRNCYHCAENGTELTICAIWGAVDTLMIGDDRLRYCCPLFREKVK